MTTASLFSDGQLDRRSSMPTASRKPVRKSGEDLRNFGVIDPQLFAERVAAFLRMIHPVKTAQAVEADTSIPAKTVAKWVEGAAGPTGRYYHRLLAVYGAELQFYVDPDTSTAQVREMALIQRQTRLERLNAAQQRRLAGQLAEIWGER